MVAIDQYNSKVRPVPFAGVLRFLTRLRLSDIVRAPIFLFRRTDAEIVAKRFREADRVSAGAGLPTVAIIAEPARLDATTFAERLTSATTPFVGTTDSIEQTTERAYASLDRIEYDLAAMWDEIGPYMESARPGSDTCS